MIQNLFCGYTGKHCHHCCKTVWSCTREPPWPGRRPELTLQIFCELWWYDVRAIQDKAGVIQTVIYTNCPLSLITSVSCYCWEYSDEAWRPDPSHWDVSTIPGEETKKGQTTKQISNSFNLHWHPIRSYSINDPQTKVQPDKEKKVFKVNCELLWIVKWRQDSFMEQCM